jgi:hypothetical protein
MDGAWVAEPLPLINPSPQAVGSRKVYALTRILNLQSFTQKFRPGRGQIIRVGLPDKRVV